MEITSINQLDLNKIYSYADYLLWRLEERVELLKGRIFKMSPAPSVKHQKVSGNLHILLHNAFNQSPCNTKSLRLRNIGWYRRHFHS